MIHAALIGLIADRDWFSEPFPDGRKLWHVPTVYGAALARQPEEAARVVGLSRGGGADRLALL